MPPAATADDLLQVRVIELLRAKPAALIISYRTRDFVEIEKNGCLIGQLLYTNVRAYCF